MQPKRAKLPEPARTCPACGRLSLERVRHDLWLSLFFIPVLPVKRGQPLWECSQCGYGAPQAPAPAAPRPTPARDEPPGLPAPGQGPGRCRFCGQPLEPGFKYCPNCGAKTAA